MKSFAKKFAAGFQFGRDDVRMGVFTYSDRAKSVLELRNGGSETSFNNAIDRMRHGGGGNRKDTAIQYASRMLQRSGRAGSDQSVLFLSNGASSAGSSSLTAIPQSFPDMDIQSVAIGRDAQIEGGQISRKSTYYESFPRLVTAGPFELTTKITQSGGRGGGGVAEGTVFFD